MDRRTFNKAVGVIGAGVLSGLEPGRLAARERHGSGGGAGGGGPAAVGGGSNHGLTEEFDLARARRETPGCATVAHFNNAGSSLPPQSVLDAVIGHLELEGRIGGYEAAAEAREAHDRAYGAVAALLSCSEDEVALVENATRAWDMAFYALKFEEGDRILTCEAEYASNYIAYLQTARKTGAVVEVLPNDESGQVSVDALEGELRKGGVGLVGITHVPTNGGLVNPAEEIGALTRAAGVPYLLDACQSAGEWPLDVEQIGCDMLSVTGRKFLRGPRGTGFLYVRNGMIQELEPPLLDLHAAEWTSLDEYVIDPTAKRFENWESYIAGRIGLGVAVDYALGWGLEAIKAQVQRVAGRLREGLDEIPGVQTRDLGHDQCGIVTFTHENASAPAIRAALAGAGINVSITSLSSTRIDMKRRGIDSMIRASAHYYNSDEEVDRLLEVVRGI